MLLNVDREIQTADGRKALYLGTLPDGRYAFAHLNNEFGGTAWRMGSLDSRQVDSQYKNLPPLTAAQVVDQLCEYARSTTNLTHAGLSKLARSLRDRIEKDNPPLAVWSPGDPDLSDF